MSGKYRKLTKVIGSGYQTITDSIRIKQKLSGKKFRILQIIYAVPVLKACGGGTSANIIGEVGNEFETIPRETLSLEFLTVPEIELQFFETQSQREIVYQARAVPVNPESHEQYNIPYTLSYRIEGDDQYLEINEQTGELFFGEKESEIKVDFENPAHVTRPEKIGTYTVDIIADMVYQGSSWRASQEISVEIVNAEEEFEFISVSEFYYFVPENFGRSFLYDADAYDQEQGLIKYRIEGIEGIEGIENDLQFFDIDELSGELSFGTEFVFDFENSQDETLNGELSFGIDFENPRDADQDNEYVVKIIASSTNSQGDVKEIEQVIRVFVTNVDERPIIISKPVLEDDQTIHFDENQPSENQPSENQPSENQPSEIIYQIIATDQDLPNDQEITYAMLEEADAQFFSLNTQTGELAFGENQQGDRVDFENPQDANQDNQYIVRVFAVSQEKTSSPQTIVVSVINVDEPPSFVTQPQDIINVFENLGLEPLYRVEAIVANQGDVLVYEISGDDALFFSLNTQTGELAFGENQQGDRVDFENPQDANLDNEYEVVISATAAGQTVTQNIIVKVNNVEEQPELTITSRTDGQIFQENSDVHRIVADAQLQKDEQQTFLSYSLLGDTQYFSINGQGEITFRGENFNFERPTDINRDNIYEISIIAQVEQTNGNIIYLEKQLDVIIEDVNDAPFRTYEGLSIGSLQTGVVSQAIDKNYLLGNFLDEDQKEEFYIKWLELTSVPEQVDRIYYESNGEQIELQINEVYLLNLLDEGFFIEIKTGEEITSEPIAISYKLGDEESFADEQAQIRFDIAETANRPPFIAIESVLELDDVSGAYLLEEQSSEQSIAEITYSDPDGDTVSIRIEGEDASFFEIRNNMLYMLFLDKNLDYEQPADFDHNNIYKVNLVAYEELSGLSSTLGVQVKIEDLQEAILQEAIGGFYFYIGTQGVDELVASDSNDVIMARESADIVEAGQGDDIIIIVGKVAQGQFSQEDYILSVNDHSSAEPEKEVNLAPALGLVENFASSHKRYQQDVTSDAQEEIFGQEGNDDIISFGISSFVSSNIQGVEEFYVHGMALITIEQLQDFENIIGNDLNSKIVVNIPEQQTETITDISSVKRVNVIDFEYGVDWDLTGATDINEFLPQAQGEIYINNVNRIIVNDISDFQSFSDISFNTETRFFVRDTDVTIDVINGNYDVYDIDFYQFMEIDKNSGLFLYIEYDQYIEYDDIIVDGQRISYNLPISKIGMIGNDKEQDYDTIGIFNPFGIINDNERFLVRDGSVFLKNAENLELGDRLYVVISANDKYEENGETINSFRKDLIFNVVNHNNIPPHKIFLNQDDDKYEYQVELELIVLNEGSNEFVDEFMNVGRIGILDQEPSEINNYLIEILPSDFTAIGDETASFDSVIFELRNDRDIYVKPNALNVNDVLDKIVKFKVRVTDKDENGIIIGQLEQEFGVKFLYTPELGVIIGNEDERVVFNIFLDKVYDRDVVVKYETNKDKTFGYTYAREGVDYIFKKGEIIFNSGEVEKQITVELLNPEYAASSIIQLDIDVQKLSSYPGQLDPVDIPKVFTSKAAVIFGSGSNFKTEEISLGYFKSRIPFDTYDKSNAPDDVIIPEASVNIGTEQGDIYNFFENSPALQYVNGVRVYVDAKAGNDRIIGTDDADHIIGGDGDDYIDAKRGFDLIYGGKGVDTIYASDTEDYRNPEDGRIPSDDRYYGKFFYDDDAIYLSLADIADDEDEHQPDIIYGFTVFRYVVRGSAIIGDSFVVSDLMLKNGRADVIDIGSYREGGVSAISLADSDVFIFDNGSVSYSNAYDAYGALLEDTQISDTPLDLSFKLFFWQKNRVEGRANKVALSYVIDPGFQDIDKVKIFDLAVFPDLKIDWLFNYTDGFGYDEYYEYWHWSTERVSYGISRSQFSQNLADAIEDVEPPSRGITAVGSRVGGYDPYSHLLDEPEDWYDALYVGEDGFFEYCFGEGQSLLRSLDWDLIPSLEFTAAIEDEKKQQFIRRVLDQIAEVIEPEFQGVSPDEAYKDIEKPNRIHFNFISQANFEVDFAAAASLRYGIFINKDYKNIDWDAGRDFSASMEYIIMHEIGHMLGLEHPHPEPWDRMPIFTIVEGLSHGAWFDDYPGKTIMTYNFKYRKMAEDDSEYIFPTTYGIYDLVQLQKTYGAGSSQEGDTIYGLNGVDQVVDFISEEPSLNKIPTSLKLGGVHDEIIVGTIYDTNGEDTIDVSHHDGPQIVTLEQGKLSSVTGLKDNLGIAFGTDIENLKTGAGDDIIITNDLDNNIDAGAGNDHIFIRKGLNVINGGAGADIFAFLVSSGYTVIEHEDVEQYSIIEDFVSGSDKLDFSRIIDDDIDNNNYKDFIFFVPSESIEGNIHITIDPDGSDGGDIPVKIAELQQPVQFDIVNFFDDLTIADSSHLWIL